MRSPGLDFPRLDFVQRIQRVRGVILRAYCADSHPQSLLMGLFRVFLHSHYSLGNPDRSITNWPQDTLCSRVIRLTPCAYISLFEAFLFAIYSVPVTAGILNVQQSAGVDEQRRHPQEASPGETARPGTAKNLKHADPHFTAFLTREARTCTCCMAFVSLALLASSTFVLGWMSPHSDSNQD